MIEMFFIKENYEGKYVKDGLEGLAAAKEADWDCIILDWMLPNMDGITICKTLREEGYEIPIIMLTAKDSEQDQVLGLEIGADDYVTKPFSPLTLLARIKAVTRRVSKQAQPYSETLYINEARREVVVQGEKINHLTPKEFDLLNFFINHERQVFSREQLLEKVWGFDFYGDDRTVDVHVKRLRSKLGETVSDCIQTIWGVGYKFDRSLLKEEHDEN